MSFFRCIRPPPPRTTLFPYTTRFRSSRAPLQGGADMTRAIPEKQPAAPECGGWADLAFAARPAVAPQTRDQDRKSTRLNSSHVSISYAVFCLKKKKGDSNSARRSLQQ